MRDVSVMRDAIAPQDVTALPNALAAREVRGIVVQAREGRRTPWMREGRSASTERCLNGDVTGRCRVPAGRIRRNKKPLPERKRSRYLICRSLPSAGTNQIRFKGLRPCLSQPRSGHP